MHIFYHRFTNTTSGRLMITAMVSLFVLPIPIQAQNVSEREILNQLYRDIIGFSPAAQVPASDSAYPSKETSSVVTSSASDAPADDQLKKEVEKMVRDAESRRDAAVKFMIDAR